MLPVNVILVNYKNDELTINCIRALERGSLKPHQIFVIDNQSSESSRSHFKEQTFSLPVKFIWNEKNLGFAAGCNQGIRASQESGFNGFIWLLNNDAEPDVHALKEIVLKAELSGAAITGSQVTDESGIFIGGVGLIHPRFASVHRPKNCDCQQFDYVEGSSFLISPQCLETIGFLSEDFFLYFEESDYCFKARKAGLKLAWATHSIIRHRIGASTGSEIAKGKVPFFIDCIMVRNRIHFALTNHFSKSGVFFGLFLSLLLRIKRKQFSRVLKILSISTSEKRFRKFVVQNGGYFEK